MIWNPWRKIRELEDEVQRNQSEIAVLNHALRQSSDRYDKIRETCAQLRSALSLYRNA